MPEDVKPDDASLDEELHRESVSQGEPEGDAAESSADAEAGDAGMAPDEDAAADSAGSESDAVVNEGDISEEDAEAAMLKMMEEEASSMDDEVSSSKADDFPDLSNIRMEEPVASPAEFQQLSPSPSGGESHRNIDMLLDVKMPVSNELGRTEMPISELLTLGPGSVVELNKLAGEPVDLLVNDKVIAKGEVVVVDENFGVRITLLLSPEERLKSLAQQ